MPAWTSDDYDEMEAAIQRLIDNPGPQLDHTGEDLALDGNGQPLSDEHVRQEAQDLLADLRRQRTGLDL